MAPRPFWAAVMPLHLAKRMVENRGGEAVESNGRLEIRRNGEWLAAPHIVDDCVGFQAICSAFVGQPGQPRL